LFRSHGWPHKTEWKLLQPRAQYLVSIFPPCRNPRLLLQIPTLDTICKINESPKPKLKMSSGPSPSWGTGTMLKGRGGKATPVRSFKSNSHFLKQLT
jgi:hypothetical protein